MHVGIRRISSYDYPWLPNYWATECQFFPGYLPWKLRVYTGVWYGVSEAGTWSDDSKIVTYLFTGVGPTSDTFIRVTIQMEIHYDLAWSSWHFEFGYMSPTPSEFWWLCQVPNRLTKSQQDQYFSTDDPHGTPFPVSIIFEPATYEEGGAPYSRYAPHV